MNNGVKPAAWLFQCMDLLSARADGRVSHRFGRTEG